ncbi:acetate--CoA ligase family protein [Chloroflexota bacterium]
MDIATQMKLFMEPRSVAAVGVTRSTGGYSFNILENLMVYGFEGKLYAVNPNAEKIMGATSYPSVKELPEDVDLAVIATPRSTIPGIIRECAAKGIRAIIVVTQGFADVGGGGEELQAEMVRAAKEGGVRIIGPNTLGTCNAFLNFDTAFTPLILEKTPIGAITQTGIFHTAGLPRFRFGKAIDLGNTCDVDFADALAYFEDDPDIRVLMLHIEGFKKGGGRRFIETASRVAIKKPVIAIKAGSSEGGGRAARSHTGSLAGKDELYNAIFKQCGIIRAWDVEEADDLAMAFLRLPVPKGKRVAIMNWSGGQGTFAADSCAEYGLNVPPLSHATMKRLGELPTPPWFPIANPVDTWSMIGLGGWDIKNFKKGFKLILEALLADENSDAVMICFADVLKYYPSEDWDISPVVSEATSAFPSKPIVIWISGPHGPLVEKLEATGVTITFPTSTRAARVLARLTERAEMLERYPE